MARIPVTSLLDPVREVIDGGIFIEVGGRLAFQHDLAREAVRSAVPDAVRRALDREAADVLLAGGALPVEVAAQLAGSAEPGDITAVRALAEAAESLGVTDPSASADIASVALSLAPSRHPLRGPLVARRTVSLFAAGRSKEARAFADNALRQSLPAGQEADVRLSLAAMFAISADDRADNARQGLSLTGIPADTRARLWASLFHNLMVASRLGEGRAIESQVRASVLASTDLAAQYFFQIGRSAMEYQLGRFEPSLRLLDGVDPGQLAGFDDPRERLTHSYRSWVLSALDRVDEAIAVADDGLAAAQRDRQNWAVHVFETWKGRHLLHLGRLDEANAALEGRFQLADAHLIVGVLDAAAVVALGRTKLHIGDERGAGEVARIAQVMLAATAPVVRRLAAWYLAVHSLASGDPSQAHRWLCALGETERLSLFPLFPMEAADDPLLVRMALAAGDEELAKTVAGLAARRYELNPGVPSWPQPRRTPEAFSTGPGRISNRPRRSWSLAPGHWPWPPRWTTWVGPGWPTVTAAAPWMPLIACCGSALTPAPYATRPEPASGYASSGSGAGSSRWTARNWAGSRSPAPSSRSPAWLLRATPTGGSPSDCSFRPIP